MSRGFVLNYLNLVQIVIAVLLLSTDVRPAEVDISGTTAFAVAGESYIDLQCEYTLDVNETATQLVWEKISGANTGNVMAWDIAGGGAATPVPPWTLTTPSNKQTATVRLPAASTTSARSGTYKCSLTHEPGALKVEAPRSVAVQYEPKVKILPGATENVNEGTPLTLQCSVDAVPKASIEWAGPSGVTLSKEARLVVQAITRDQAGTYKCTATNRLTPTVGAAQSKSTTASSKVVVRYIDSPIFNVSESTVRENDTVSFTCSTTSLPLANLSIVEPDGKVMISSTAPSITMTKTMGCLTDSGSYICHAATTYSSTWLRNLKDVQVMCKPRKDPRKPVHTTITRNINQTAAFVAHVVAYPSPSLQWMKKQPGSDQLTPLTSSDQRYVIVYATSRLESTLRVTARTADDFTQYFLKAKNREGEATLEYVLTSRLPPIKPENLEIVNSTTDSITVMWTSKYDGGLAQSYFLQYHPITEGNEIDSWTEVTTPLPDPGRERSAVATIRNILPGRDYRIRVYSKNAQGSSPFSDTVSTKTADSPSPLHFGIGILIGIIITIVVVGIAVGIFVFIRRRKTKETVDTRDNGPNYENQVFNAETASGSQAYASLNGVREKPSTSNYASLNNANPTYVNLGEAASASGTTSPDVYMNYKPPELDSHTNGTANGATGGVYENTKLNKRPGKVKKAR